MCNFVRSFSITSCLRRVGIFLKMLAFTRLSQFRFVGVFLCCSGTTRLSSWVPFGRMVFCMTLFQRQGQSTGFGRGEVLLAQAGRCRRPRAKGLLIRGAVAPVGGLTA